MRFEKLVGSKLNVGAVCHRRHQHFFHIKHTIKSERIADLYKIVGLAVGPRTGKAKNHRPFNVFLAQPNSNFWLHIFCPVIAIVSYIAWDKPAAGIWVVLLGMLPVMAYGILYLNKVLREKTWDDFYGFNKNGKWKISAAAMTIGCFLVSFVLWVL